jgi:RNA polymerase sigma-70 factor, ECF subfamily
MQQFGQIPREYANAAGDPMNQPDSDQLVMLARAGDAEAGHSLLTRHQNRLRRMIASVLDARVARRIDASDVLQDTMARATQKLPEYLRQPSVALYPWLRQIAKDIVVEVHRKHLHAGRRTVTKEEDVDFQISQDSAMDLAARLVSHDASPSKLASRREMACRVRDAMNKISSADRELLLMSFVEQLRTQDIAEILSVTSVTVRSRLRLAIERLGRFVVN